MNIIVGILALIIIIAVLQDAFETIILPRRVSRGVRLARFFYIFAWKFWSTIGRWIRSSDRRDFFLSYFGPLSLILLLVLWASLLIVGFSLIQWSIGSQLNAPERVVSFSTDLYMSGTTFFTLGLGDVTPGTGLARVVTVIEAGIGFGFLALIIGYVPIIYQAFSRREAAISLLDARAGSPPSATEFLRRHSHNLDRGEFLQQLRDWEHWSSELLESHLSYPVLMYYRSQHDRQSWLAALTTILDASALVMVGIDGLPAEAGQFTFAIARHAAVDLSQVFGADPHDTHADRLPPLTFAKMRESLEQAGITLQGPNEAEKKLAEYRSLYEPYVNAIAERLLLSLPDWLVATETVDDWQTSAWEHHDTAPSLSNLHRRNQS